MATDRGHGEPYYINQGASGERTAVVSELVGAGACRTRIEFHAEAGENATQIAKDWLRSRAQAKLLADARNDHKAALECLRDKFTISRIEGIGDGEKREYALCDTQEVYDEITGQLSDLAEKTEGDSRI